MKSQLIRVLLIGLLAIAGLLGWQDQQLAEQLWQVIPKFIHDGDTIRVQRGHQQIKVRFACIDAPELKQPMGRQSRDFLRSLLDKSGNQVYLQVVDRDRYGRQVALVFTAQGELVQERQASAGMVYVFERYIANCPAAQRVRQAQEVAQRQRLGIWARDFQKPWDYRAGL
jgi:micrococcal nuclease